MQRVNEGQAIEFAFTPENKLWVQAKIGDYPRSQRVSAIVPLLWRAQEQSGGWLPEPALECVADLLGLPYTDVYNVASFYTMFQLTPRGTVAHVDVCYPADCAEHNAGELIEICRRRIALRPGVLSPDGRFSWGEGEGAGGCAGTSVVFIAGTAHEDLSAAEFEALLDALEAGEDTGVGAAEATPAATLEALVQTVSLSEAADAALAEPAEQTPEEPQAVEPVAASAGAESDGEGERPPAYTREELDEVDDLKTSKGIGKVLEGKLNGLGVFRFEQIASWTEEHKAWVDGRLNFRGRIDREKWVEQAAERIAER